jgi:HSP20 family protein
MAAVITEIGRGLDRAWERLGADWRGVLRGMQNALTRYTPVETEPVDAQAGWPWLPPAWGVLPGEVMETSRSIVVHIELPGLNRDDFDVEISEHELRVRGEKRIDRSYDAESYYLRERAYGRFERVVALPPNVDTSGARASYRSGVLTVELRKKTARPVRYLRVQ